MRDSIEFSSFSLKYRLAGKICRAALEFAVVSKQGSRERILIFLFNICNFLYTNRKKQKMILNIFMNINQFNVIQKALLHKSVFKK